MNNFISGLLRYILYAVFIAGLAATATVPIMLDRYMIYFYDAYSIQPNYKLFITVFLMITGVILLWIIFELILMVRTLPKNPFVISNADSLKRTGIAALAGSVLFFAKCCIYFTVLTGGCGAILFICSLFSFTLSSLFKKAVEYKEENDLTI